jgi:hypothetical protein
MVQEVSEITPDAYLMIVYGKDKDAIKVKQYDVKVKKSSKNLLDTPLKSNIATVALAGLTSSIGQNIAGKALSNATLGRINSSIYDIMSDGKISVPEVAEDFIGSCTNAIDNVATDMGLPTPSSLYTALMPGGTGVISKDFANLLGKKMDAENKEEEEKLNEGEYTVLKFKIVTGDKENWGMDIPTRKTEKGFEIATAINNHNKAKDFEVLLCTNDKAGTDMYQIKNQLEELRSQKVPFDVYVNDKDVYNQYKLSNCLFSSLDFNPNGKNALNCSMSVVEIPEWDVEIVKLDSSYKGKYSVSNNTQSSNNANKKAGIAKVAKSATSIAKTATNKISNQQTPSKSVSKDIEKYVKSLANNGKNSKEIQALVKKHGATLTIADIDRIRGVSISAKK